MRLPSRSKPPSSTDAGRVFRRSGTQELGNGEYNDPASREDQQPETHEDGGQSGLRRSPWFPPCGRPQDEEEHDAEDNRAEANHAPHERCSARVDVEAGLGETRAAPRQREHRHPPAHPWVQTQIRHASYPIETRRDPERPSVRPSVRRSAVGKVSAARGRRAPYASRTARTHSAQGRCVSVGHPPCWRRFCRRASKRNPLWVLSPRRVS